VLGLVSAIPPFLTVWFERRMERAGALEGGWRLGHAEARPENAVERVLHVLLARPAVAVAVGLVAVAALTGVALVVGPPASVGG
jgi:hypothetical protein